MKPDIVRIGLIGRSALVGLRAKEWLIGMATKKNLKYYLSLPWSYSVEKESRRGKLYYIIRIDELPGICTDAETLVEGFKLIKEALEGAIKLYLKFKEPIPEPKR